MISDYLRDLRAIVGTRLILMPASGVLFRDEGNRILLVRAAGSDAWETVGGAVDPDEHPAEAARREALEEVGIEPVDLRLLGVVGGPAFRVTYAHGDVVSYVGSIYEASTGGAQPVPDGEEIVEAAWFDKSALSSVSLLPTAIEILERFGWPERDPRSVGKVLEIDHVQLAMPAGCEDEARAFYVGVLGLEEEPKPAHLAARGGAWFRGGEARLHLGVDGDFRPATKAHPALLVDDLAVLVARLRAAGAEPTTDQPLDGYERLYVSDPFGNRIELMQRTG